jgi:hypothetical protein
MVSSMGNSSVEAANTPADISKAKAVSDENPKQIITSSNTAAEPVKLRCRDAKEKDARSLCDTLIPPELRDDGAFMDAFEIIYCAVDLNGDGANEFIAWESSWAGTSGGSLSVLSKSRDGYKTIFETEMTWTPIILLSSTHQGWKDFAYLQTGGGLHTTYVVVFHNGRSYSTVNGPELSQDQPDGDVLIPREWSSSAFGPISDK